LFCFSDTIGTIDTVNTRKNEYRYMAVNFFLRGKSGLCTIFARIRSRKDGMDIRITTRLYIDASAWEKGHRDIESLKRFRIREKATFDKLDKIERTLNLLLENGTINNDIASERINEIVYAEEIAEETEKERIRAEEEKAARMTDLNAYIQKYIDEMRSGTRKNNKGMLYSPGTIKNKVSFQSEFNKFQEYTGHRYNYDDITMDFYNDFIDFFNDKEYSPNTTGKHIKSLKEIMSAAFAEGLHENTQSSMRSFKILSAEADTVYLTRQEITAIENLDLSGDKHKELSLCRDVFLVGVYTAQRYSDYHRINKTNIITLGNGINAIRLTQQKTGAKVVIPLTGKLDTLLKKYKYNLPKTYSQIMNESIKVICRIAGITQKVEHTSARGARIITERIEKHKLITTHTARRTGATLMYLEGMDTLSVMKITGHKTEKEFKKYIRVGEEENALLVSTSKFFG
jgi:integrase